jgi:hypothetical protein
MMEKRNQGFPIQVTRVAMHRPTRVVRSTFTYLGTYAWPRQDDEAGLVVYSVAYEKCA